MNGIKNLSMTGLCTEREGENDNPGLKGRTGRRYPGQEESMGRKEILTVLPELERWLYWLARTADSEQAQTLNRYAMAVNRAQVAILADALMEDDGK
jgi:hypothetical protein